MAEMNAPVIETRDLWQQRGERATLKGIDIRVEKGEVFALIGPTGAGKTTLLRLISLLDTPARGAVLLDGADVNASERIRLAARRRMAFVLQKPVVFNSTVYENIACGLKWHGMERRKIREKVASVLQMVDLADYGDRNARTLSGGEMQRVAIGRAIAVDPEVLLLDEPTANLDPLSAAKIEELISGIIRRNDITVIMSTHDMAQGQSLADRIAVLIDGEIRQAGVSREIFASPKSHDVAEFVGMENIINGVVTANEADLAQIDAGGNKIEACTSLGVGETVSVCIRPEDITVALERHSSSARNALSGRISRAVSAGPLCRVEIDCGFPLIALVTRRSAEELGFEKDKPVYASFKAVSIHVIKRH